MNISDQCKKVMKENGITIKQMQQTFVHGNTIYVSEDGTIHHIRYHAYDVVLVLDISNDEIIDVFIQ